MDEKQLRHTLKLRIDRLKKLSDLNAPDMIIANEINLVRRAMFRVNIVQALESEQVFRETEARWAFGFCSKSACKNYAESDTGLCLSCLAKQDQEDAKFDEEE